MLEEKRRFLTIEQVAEELKVGQPGLWRSRWGK